MRPYVALLFCLLTLLCARTSPLHAQEEDSILGDFHCNPVSCEDGMPEPEFQGAASVEWAGDCYPASENPYVFPFDIISTAIVGTTGKCSALYSAKVVVTQYTIAAECGTTTYVNRTSNIYNYLGVPVLSGAYSLYCDSTTHRGGSPPASEPC
jgi:hypothetical protein